MKSLATVALLCALSGAPDDYEALLADAAAKDLKGGEAMRTAHAALDEGAYEHAVDLARRARSLGAEAATARTRARLRLEGLVPELVVRLDDDDFDVRESASQALRRIGRPALPGLVELRKGKLPAEAQARVDCLLGGITVDREGRVHQWASEATASSEYAAEDWSARQAVGPPDSPEGDSRTAWAAKDADGGPEWLTVKFVLSVRIRRIRIHENLTPGGVVRIDAVGEDGIRRPVWQGEDPALPWFEADLESQVSRELVIVLDTRKHSGWEEIDAVELIGDSRSGK
jgi:HEAT repeat protein